MPGGRAQEGYFFNSSVTNRYYNPKVKDVTDGLTNTVNIDQTKLEHAELGGVPHLVAKSTITLNVVDLE